MCVVCTVHTTAVILHTILCIVKEFNLNKNNVFFYLYILRHKIISSCVSFSIIQLNSFIFYCISRRTNHPVSILPSKHKPLIIIVIKLIFNSIIFIAIPIIYWCLSRSPHQIYRHSILCCYFRSCFIWFVAITWGHNGIFRKWSYNC